MDKCYYKDFIEDEKQFYLHEAGFDGREEQLFRLRVYDGKTLEEAAEIMDYGYGAYGTAYNSGCGCNSGCC